MTDKEKKLRNKLGYSWYQKAAHLLQQNEVRELAKWIAQRRKTIRVKVFPESEHLFTAFRLTPFEEVKVVILGQDPYHSESNVPIAHGLAFSSQDPFERPPSLQNIFKEVEQSAYDGLQLIQEADLTRWAIQGVFLLNTALTVEKGKPESHMGKGWEKFTEPVIRMLAEDDEPKVFMLWGRKANEAYDNALNNEVDDSKHLVLRASHPAAEEYRENAGFFGCDHFKLANDFLREKHLMEIKW